MAGGWLSSFLAGTNAGEQEVAQGQAYRRQTALQELLARRRQQEQEAQFAHSNAAAATAHDYNRDTASTLAGTQATAATVADTRLRDRGVEDFGRNVALKGIDASNAMTLHNTPKPKAPYTMNPGDQRFDENDQMTASVPPLPVKPTEGDARRAEIENYLTNVRKLTPGTPQYAKEFMDWRNRPLTIAPGGAAFNMTDALGGGTPPAPAPAGVAGSPAAPAAPVAPKPIVERAPTEPTVPAASTEQFADFKSLLGQFDRIKTLYKPEYVGALQGRAGAFRSATGIGARQDEVAFRREMADLQNRIVYLYSGKQINEQEFKRLQAALPGLNDPDMVFAAKLNGAQLAMQEMLVNREQEFARRGYRNTGPAPGTNAPNSGALLPGVSSVTRVK